MCIISLSPLGRVTWHWQALLSPGRREAEAVTWHLAAATRDPTDCEATDSHNFLHYEALAVRDPPTPSCVTGVPETADPSREPVSRRGWGSSELYFRPTGAADRQVASCSGS